MGHTAFERTSLPSLYLLDDRVGHARYQIGQGLGAVDFREVSLDVAYAHAAGVHAQNFVVEALERALVLFYKLGLERAGAVARHLDGRVALIGTQCLFARAVARVATTRRGPQLIV